MPPVPPSVLRRCLRHLQIAQHPLQRLRVGVVVLPAAEVADVAVVAQLAGPCLGRLHHGVVEADWEQDQLLAGALLGEALVTSSSTQSLLMAFLDRISSTLSRSRIASSMA